MEPETCLGKITEARTKNRVKKLINTRKKMTCLKNSTRRIAALQIEVRA